MRPIEDHVDLENHVAALPNQLAVEPELAKRFDMMMLRLHQCVLGIAAGFDRCRARVVEIAGRLRNAVPDASAIRPRR